MRCALPSEGVRAPICADAQLSPHLNHVLDRARMAIDEAQSAGSVKRARKAVRGSLRLLDSAARSVRKAEASGAIRADCGKALRRMLHDAKVAARQWLKDGP